MKIENVGIGFGSLLYDKGVRATPETSRTEGNVTIKNMGDPGKPAHFRATYQIQFDATDGEVREFNLCSITLPIIGVNPADTSYAAIEHGAATTLPTILRMIADQLDAEFERLAEEKPEQSK